MAPDDVEAGRFARADPLPEPELALVAGELVDSHAHLDLLPDVEDVLARAARAGVRRVVTIGVDPLSNEWAVTASGSHPNVWATVGLHPHDAKLTGSEVRAAMERQAHEPRVVGVGEAGLDYYYDHSPRAQQREVFAWQVGLAHRARKPLVIHVRDAFDDLFSILEEEGPPSRIVFHCWSGGPAEATRALAMGAVLSFSGTLTFKNAQPVREAAQLTPLDRMIVETDAPFLTPMPYRGKRNEPAYVGVTARALAALKGVAAADLARATSENAAAVFDLHA